MPSFDVNHNFTEPMHAGISTERGEQGAVGAQLGGIRAQSEEMCGFGDTRKPQGSWSVKLTGQILYGITLMDSLPIEISLFS